MKELWKKIGMPELHDQLCTFESPSDVIQQILVLNEEKKVLIVCMLWQWWHKRNKLNKEGKIISTEAVWRQAQYWASECLFYCRQGKKEMQKPAVCWNKPEENMLKINTDGAYNADTNRGGWGFVIRDSYGDARGSGAGAVTYAGSALHMEAQACSEALHAAVQWGMVNITLETDSSILARALQSKDYDLLPEGVIFRDIRAFIRLNFWSVDVTFVPRTCNKVAHLIAAYGAHQNAERLLWPENVLDDVKGLVASESVVPN
jgi:hypothetical protein